MEGEDKNMKIKGFLVTGIILCVLGIGATAVASTQIDFNEEFDGLFTDPSLEEKEESFGEIVKVHYDGAEENLDIIYAEGENTFTYYEGKSVSYEIRYDEDLKELFINQNRSFSFFSISFGRKKAVLSINSSLEEIEIDAAAGNVGIKNMTISRARLDVNAGNLKIENSRISALDIVSDAGNVRINQLSTDTGIIEVKAGNLKIENSNINSAKITADAGNVNLLDSTFTTLSIKLSAGNLTFVGDVLTEGEFRLSAGNLNMTLARSKNQYIVNGEGTGDTIILYKVSAGNTTVNYNE